LRFLTGYLTRRLSTVLAFGLSISAASAQTTAQPPAAAPQAAQNDRSAWVAETLIGKALFLRGFYVANDLKYDAAGTIQGAPKAGDWTLTGVNVLKTAVRPGEIELDGVRVAIRYNAEQHQFERHPLNDEKMKIVIATTAAAKGFEAAVAAIFSFGIDPALQRSTPDYWQHYFNPALPWPSDALDGVVAYPTYGLPNQAKDVIPAKMDHREAAKFTSFAEHDRIKGPVLLRMVVDAAGVPRRISIAQPLGYGLDERAVEAMAKSRFSPGTREGQPVATGVVVAQDFEFVAAPGH
jgi:TonB family protein